MLSGADLASQPKVVDAQPRHCARHERTTPVVQYSNLTPRYSLGGILISLAPGVPKISVFVTWNLVLPSQRGRKSLGSLFAAVRSHEGKSRDQVVVP